MSELIFDEQSEQELTALEQGEVGDFLRSARVAFEPDTALSERLEGRLRSIVVDGSVDTPAGKPLVGAEVAAPRTASAAPDRSMARPPRLLGRGLRWVSVGLGLAAMLVLAFWLSGQFSSRTSRGIISDPSGGGSASTRTLPGGTATRVVQGDAFVPTGNVRHIILVGSQTITDTTGKATTEEVHREEFWLAPGQNHYLMRSYVPQSGVWTLLDDDSYYEYDPQNGDTVTRYSFDPKYQASVVPDPNIITDTLQMPGARSLGETIWNGRRALLIELSNDSAGTDEAVGAKGTPSGSNGTQEADSSPVNMYWIDLETNQILQVEIITVDGDGQTRDVHNYIELDELIDRSSLPPEYFTFELPPGASLVDNRGK